eukprot:TRINITY_DN716_c0_g1_i4.p1 TRINITY_DN716_c0_g1~~TRINITY_DN716_c0_g1_i4.p1  ORF type:complete len:258 (-),score=32.42 TRINITY_DN716_c0_g1_i4:697-1470(-)
MEETKLSVRQRRDRYRCQKRYVRVSDIDHWLAVAPSISDDQPQHPDIVPDNVLNSKISYWKGDITTLEIDAIANAANSSLLGGGGVDGAIHANAGYKLRQECEKLNGCSTGDAKITRGYNLPAKYVIHTVGPIGLKPDLLASCYNRILDTLVENKLRTIAIPCISTGVFGYPVLDACIVALQTTRSWLEHANNITKVDRIIFCLFTQSSVQAYISNLPIYFPVEKECDNSISNSNTVQYITMTGKAIFDTANIPRKV